MAGTVELAKIENNGVKSLNEYVFPTKRIYTQGLAKIRTYKKEGFEHRIVNK